MTTQGLEVDFNWFTSVPGLSLSGSWAYLDAEITGDFFLSGIDGVGENSKGRDAGFAPDISGNLAINWETNLTDGIRLRISPNIAYKDDFVVGAGEEFNAVTNPTGALVQDSYTTLDLNISVFSPEESWRLSLIGKNLGDEDILTFAGPAPFRPADGDDQLVGLARGRQVFVEAAFRF